MPPFKEAIKVLGFDAVRALVYGLVILFMLLGATAVFGNQQAKANAYLSAIGCELGVPAIDGVRDPVLLRACWADEGLQPPAYFDD